MPTLLDRKDRMSMACGLEVRVPFCDHRLAEYVWNIPWEIKMTGGMEKGVLRRALAGLLPEAVLTRRKSPYPKTHNPKYLAATKRWLTEIIADPTSPILQLVDVKTVKRVIQEDAAGFSPSWFGQLMGAPQLFAYLAQVDTWLRKYRITITC
jgi:asparagine synthase (glutamine-hydrolysing)